MMIHRRLAGVLLAAAVTACTDADLATTPGRPSLAEDAGHNAAEQLREVNPVAIEIENPCNGELIAFSGTMVLTATFVDKEENLENGNSVHSQTTVRTDATGTGPVSGAGYTVHDIFTQNFESPSPPAPQFTATVHATTIVVSSDPALTFRLNLLVHVLASPATGFKVTREVEGATCLS